MTTAGHSNVAETSKKPPTEATFNIQSPHGSVIYATTTGIQLRYGDTPEIREGLAKWLESLPAQFAAQAGGAGMLVICPKCKGKLQMVNDKPVLCVLCKGMMRVTKETAIHYNTIMATAVPQVIQHEAPTSPMHEVPSGETIPAPADEILPPTDGDPDFIGPHYDPELAGRG